MAKLTELEVSFISLVDKPANKLDIVFKCRDKYNRETLIKVETLTDEGLVKGTVYEPNVKDTDGDWADEATIKKAAHDFLLNGRNFNVDTDHNQQPAGAAVVESFINAKGAWEVVLKMDPKSDVFKSVKEGKYKGLSMMALAKKEEGEPPTQKSDIEALKELVDKQSKQLEDLKAEIAGVSKTRQLVIDADGNIDITKRGQDPDVLQEFNFANLK